MDTVRRAVAFVLGVLLCIFGVTGEAVQWDVIAVAAGLMGLSSADQIRDFIEHRDDADPPRPPPASGQPHQP